MKDIEITVNAFTRRDAEKVEAIIGKHRENKLATSESFNMVNALLQEVTRESAFGIVNRLFGSVARFAEFIQSDAAFKVISK